MSAAKKTQISIYNVSKICSACELRFMICVAFFFAVLHAQKCYILNVFISCYYYYFLNYTKSYTIFFSHWAVHFLSSKLILYSPNFIITPAVACKWPEKKNCFNKLINLTESMALIEVDGAARRRWRWLLASLFWKYITNKILMINCNWLQLLRRAKITFTNIKCVCLYFGKKKK